MRIAEVLEIKVSSRTMKYSHSELQTDAASMRKSAAFIQARLLIILESLRFYDASSTKTFNKTHNKTHNKTFYT